MFQLFQRHGHGRGAGDARLQHALAEHRLVDDQFADEIDQTVDAIEIDANRRTHRRAGLRLRRHRLDRPLNGLLRSRTGSGGRTAGSLG